MTVTIAAAPLDQVLIIRHQVLWPDKEPDFCRVPDDELADHYGVYVDQQLVSVGSIYHKGDSARLRKFATLEYFQGQGLGSKLLHYILDELMQQGTQYFWCDARQTAIGFYQRYGMCVEGEPFIKSGIPYIKMAKNLS